MPRERGKLLLLVPKLQGKENEDWGLHGAPCNVCPGKGAALALALRSLPSSY